MKVISIWQPWASLIIHGHKFIETRGWPAPASLIGQQIGIAATKTMKPDQIAAFEDVLFQHHYSSTGLPPLNELPMGAILGTALLHSCAPIDRELIDGITAAEQCFGWYLPGRYAWRLRNPRPFRHPIVAKGAQGVWTWNEHQALQIPYQDDAGQEGSPDLRRDL